MAASDDEDETDLTPEQISNIRAAAVAYLGKEAFREKMISELLKEGFDREAAKRVVDSYLAQYEVAFAKPTSH